MLIATAARQQGQVDKQGMDWQRLAVLLPTLSLWTRRLALASLASALALAATWLALPQAAVLTWMGIVLLDASTAAQQALAANSHVHLVRLARCLALYLLLQGIALLLTVVQLLLF